MRQQRFLTITVVFLILLSGCTRKQEPVKIEYELVQEDVVTFFDGNSVSLWQNEPFGFGDCYRLADGTDLLLVESPIWPENCGVGEMSLNLLNEAAQMAISAYYQEQGILYDVNETLHRCYDDYLATREAKMAYYSHILAQSVSPYSFGEKVVCFLTSVQEPVFGTDYHMETRYHAFFDRETGEPVSVWELFTVPKEEAIEEILSYGNYDAQTIADMRAALKPEYIGLSGSCLEVDFPYGVLPNQEYATGIAIRYHELNGLLHDWAIPPQED